MSMYLGVRGTDGKIRDVSDSNGYPMQLTGSNVKDAFEGTANTTKTYVSKMQGFSIQNDGAANLTFTIGGLTITVKPTEGYEDRFDPFTSVQIITTGAFRAVVRG